MSSAGGDAEYMFAQTSSGVAIDLDGRITLEGVSPTTLFFSDRPYRLMGHVATDEFVAQLMSSRIARPGRYGLLAIDLRATHRTKERPYQW
jgi:hypothetical protein